jgi:hypothetical protein
MECLLVDIFSELEYHSIKYEVVPDYTMRGWLYNMDVYNSHCLKEARDIINEMMSVKPPNANKLIMMCHHVVEDEYYIYYDFE